MNPFKFILSITRNMKASNYKEDYNKRTREMYDTLKNRKEVKNEIKL